MRKIILLAMMVVFTGCSDEDGAREALQEQGYTKIEITGHAWTGCGKEDSYSTGFIATTQAGYRVRGVVCSSRSLFGGKANTVRTFGRAQ